MRRAIAAAVVSGVYAIDLGTSITELSHDRQRLDLAHEVGHLVLPSDNDHDTGMLQFLKLAVARAKEVRLEDTGDFEFLPPPEIPPARISLSLPLPDTRWQEPAPFAQQMGRVNRPDDSIRLQFGQGTVLGDLWAETRCTYLLLEATLRCLAGLRSILAGLQRPRRSYTLIVLAVSRRFGHRSEPDDHASLFIRRQLVSMGSCVPM